MKKVCLFAVIFALLLTACGTPAAQTHADAPTETDAPIETVTGPNAADFVGAWQDRVSQRATMNLLEQEYMSAYTATISWGSSATETTVWTLPCAYDEQTHTLTYTGGTKENLTFSEDGAETAETVWNDSEGTLRINDDGEIEWADSREEAAPSVRFVRVYSATPSQEAFVEEYFHVIGGVEQGTAGASLKLDRAAYDAMDFANRYQLWNADIPALRDTMLAAWESMTDEERSAFDANFIDVVRQIDLALDDYEGIKSEFEDAGIGDAMQSLLEDPFACESWRTLCAHTLTMGNSEG